jgi:hypothetical protein
MNKVWPLWCLFFFDTRILITPLISPNSSSESQTQNSIIVEAKTIEEQFEQIPKSYSKAIN